MSSIKQIKSFVMVADLKSFTNAADAMFMTQPAVSSQIKSLEEHLGIELIHRNEKRVDLTEAGKQFYREAREILAAYERSIEVMDDFKGLKRGRLALGASTIPGEYLMPKYIGEFRKLYPGINVSLKVGDTGRVIEMLEDRRIDLGVVGGRLEISHMEFTPFLKDELVLLAAMDSPVPDVMDLNELLTVPLIAREPNSGTQMTIRESLAEHMIKEQQLNIVMELGSTQSVITGVIADLGLGFVSKFAAEAALKSGLVRKITIKGLDLNRELFVVTLKNAITARTRDIFTQFLLEHR